MHVMNARESSEYFDSLVDECADSAVTVIHSAWVEHSSTHHRQELLEPTTPLDMLILYQATAETFRSWVQGPFSHETLAPGDHVVNWEQARQRLKKVTDAELANLATRFANRVLVLSQQAVDKQDLHYFVELFLQAVQDRRAIEDIVQGRISRHAKALRDPDLW